MATARLSTHIPSSCGFARLARLEFHSKPKMTMGLNRLLFVAVACAVVLAMLLLVGPGGHPMTIGQIFDSALSVFGVRTAEEPRYEVIDRIGQVEVRRYAPRFAAETTVAGKRDDGMNEAFFILAGYIFGGNKRKEEIAMTAPVAIENGETIAMTAPVATQTSAGGLTMRFFLPASITPSNAPEPNDRRVRLAEETIAALRFAGTWSESTLALQQRELLTALAGSRWQPSGEPFTQFYDPPFTLPFLRRNEVAVKVSPPN
jgi:SOUL heme-binding protein